MIVAIDGPAGSGKSTTAHAVARRLGFRHLDSGAFYRALTFAALRAGVPADTWDSLSMQELASFGIRAEPAAEGYRLFAWQEDITDQLRSPQVNAHVSRMARVPNVRRWLLDRLRAAAIGTDLVADGRDIGTVVFPDAQLKIFLVADLETRARRRLGQQGRRDLTVQDVAAEVERIAQRDRLDSERAVAPLRRAPDAVDIDTTNLTFKAQVDRIVELVNTRRAIHFD